jgi:hypothetical protein
VEEDLFQLPVKAVTRVQLAVVTGRFSETYIHIGLAGAEIFLQMGDRVWEIGILPKMTG